MRKTRKTRKALAALLVVLMTVALVPTSAFAEDDGRQAAGIITAFAPLATKTAQIEYAAVDAPGTQKALPLPTALTATVEGEVESVEVPVTWETPAGTPYDAAPGSYTFTATPGKDYTLAKGLSAPTIAVKVTEDSTEETGTTPNTDEDATEPKKAKDTFVAVKEISGVPEAATVDTPLALTGTALPETATNKTIVWSLAEAGEDEEAPVKASIAIDKQGIANLTAKATGIVYLTATVTDGAADGADFTQRFVVDITEAPKRSLRASTPNTNIFDITEGNITIAAGTDADTLKVTYGSAQEKDNIAKTEMITITGGGTQTSKLITVASGVTANITLNDVNINVSATDDACAFNMNGAEVNLTLQGTNILKSGFRCAGLQASSGSTLMIGGEGSLSAASGPSKGLTYSLSAGIGGGNSSPGGTITINSGTVTATGSRGCAGIGGRSSGGTITINGGTVTATGDRDGAGIGGSYGGGGEITINGGTVKATGGESAAGIGGGGQWQGSGTITINGGTVNATGGNSGAGIGGGNQGDFGTIKISGGTVNATGGGRGSGIGGGQGSTGGGNGGIIIISGGIVTAQVQSGAYYGSAIGCGYSANNGEVIISGGTVKAIGGIYEVAIKGSKIAVDGTYTYWTNTADTTDNSNGSPTATGVTFEEDSTTFASNKGIKFIKLEEYTIPGIVTPSLLKGTVGVSYSDTLSASGATPFSWELDGSSLPGGLDLDSPTGVISGTPTAAGTFSFTVKATNDLGSGTKDYTVTVAKGTGASVSQPIVEGDPTSSSITVNEAEITGNSEQTAEYAISKSDRADADDLGWQSETTFSDLDPNTAYYVYVQAKGSANYNVGAPSVSAAITTAKENVTNAAITVTAPATGNTPLTTAPADGTGYTCSAVTWSPAVMGGKFLGGTQYTASVTLTAGTDYTFAGGLSTATINTNNATVDIASGGASATLTYQFMATDAAAVSDIAVTSQPTKGEYTYGETLDLAGLQVMLTYNDDTTRAVALSDFETYGITANPNNGDALAMTDGGKPVTLTCNSQTTDTNNLTVSKAAGSAVSKPVADGTPTASSIKVSAVTITGNNEQSAEYAISDSDSANVDALTWQSSATFDTNLAPNTAYYVYARAKGNTNYNVGAAAMSAAITTAKATLDGTVTIDNTDPQYGDTLTADTTGLTSTPDISDTTGLGTLSYQWMRDGSSISEATSSTYTVGKDDVGKEIAVTVTAAHCTGAVSSDATTAVAKAAGPTDALTVTGGYAADGDTFTYTVTAIVGAEYRIDGGTWQDSNEFSGIAPETTHTFSARIKTTATHKAGAPTDGDAVTFDKLAQSPPVLEYTITGDTYPRTVAITPITGAAYSFDGGETWDESNSQTFNSGEEITLAIRMKETATHHASDAATRSANTALIYLVTMQPGTITQGAAEAAEGRIDAPYDRFLRLTLNGKAVDPSSYSAKSGSTIITFSGDYLKTLAAGTYTFRAEFGPEVNTIEGYADLRLTVREKTDETSAPGMSDPTTAPSDNGSDPSDNESTAPQTGDSSNMTGWLIALLVSVLSILGIFVGCRWRRLKGTR